LLFAKILLLYFGVHSYDVEAVGNSKHSNKEYQEEDLDIYKHVNNHSYESCSLLEHPHEIEQPQPQEKHCKPSDDVKTRVLI